MPEEPRRNRVFLQENTKPLEGTEKHPQGRLFNPSGQFSGDPWKLAPDNWMKQSDTPAHDDLITWHSSESSQLPRTDEYEDRAFEPGHGTGPDWEGSDEDYEDAAYNDELEWEDENRYSEDSQGRPMGEYGSAVGMHFGSPAAAKERSTRSFVHPVRIPNNTLADPPSGGFSTEVPGGNSVSDMHRSHRDIVNSHTGERTPDERWSDKAANYSEAATDLVEGGKTLAYRNDIEAVGSTSYRALPETTRTWGEDVLAAKSPMTGRPASEKYGWNDDQAFRNTPHPGLVAAAEAGYNPVTRPYQGDAPNFNAYSDPLQLSLPFDNEKEAPRHGRPALRVRPSETTSDGTPYEPSQEEKLDRMARRWQSHDMNKAQATRTEAFNAGTLWSMQKPKSIG